MLPYLLIVGAVILGVATGAVPTQIAGYFREGLLDWTTIQLLGIVTTIEMLTVFLQNTGSLQRILVALRRVIGDPRILSALVPSVLGLFPVPGGAILSAPMVDSYGNEIGYDADTKASVNLFFRHVWDQVFPFKPHLILASVVLNIPLFTLIGWHLPVTIATTFVGYWYLVGRRAKTRVALEEEEKTDPGHGLPLWIEIAPFVIPLVMALAFGIDFLYAMAAGLLFALVTQRASRVLLEKMVAKGVQPKLLFTLASVMVFKTAVDHSGLVGGIAAAFTGYGIPVVALAIGLPIIVGAATGLEVAVVGIVFPIMLGLIPQGSPVIPYVLVMMISNSVGSTLSPVHICMVAGNDYFGARLGRVMRLSVPPQLFRMSAGIAMAWALATYWQR